ncbi:MAG: hypothetical protein E6R05_03940 [Candidatus Moraniibacteriota bacterium]|jgi:DNA-binding transcriptional ArsR family regulator|nr:MAG: hypothetical protein E6R05_03940 [Candidatus Moranbacteria bacterium]
MSVTLFESLFGSRVRARLIRFFTMNPEGEFGTSDIAERTLLSRNDVSREAKKLAKMKFIHERSRQGKRFYVSNTDFPFYIELKSLVSKLNVNAEARVFRKLKTIGEVKLILISGLFLNYPKAKVDMILVVNNLNRAKLRQAVSHLEAEVGKEVRFVLMNSEELQYRLNMLDRFFIEFLEGPYEEVVNKVAELKRFVAGIRK